MRPPGWVALLALICFSSGCSFGPKALERSHGEYAESIRRVDHEQLLRQLVMLRYNETSLGVDVSSIAAQYELDASADARPFFLAPNPSSTGFRTFTSILPDLSFTGSTRPTISMVPLDDGSTVRRYMTPITLDTLVFLTQTSWPVSTIARVWIERMNGVPNAASASGPPREVAPEFERFARIADLLQASQNQELAAVRTDERLVPVGGPFPASDITPTAAVEAAKAGLEYVVEPTGKSASLIRRQKRLYIEISPGAEMSPEIVEMMSLLNVVPGKRTYDISVASRGSPDPSKFPIPPSEEVRIVTRSTAQAAYYLSNGVDVPSEHMCSGLVRPMIGPDGKPFDAREITRGLFAVHVCRGGHRPPAEAFVAIRYRGYWFYIDDRDQESKATLSLLLHLSHLDFARQQLGGSAPALTLPVGR